MKDRGFTLIEVMITVAILAILATIALPSYTEYVRRGQLTEAPSVLADYRVRMEQWYQDNRTYANAGGGGCGVAAPAAPAAQYFTYTCVPGGTGQTYAAAATGIPGTPTAGFRYTLNELNARTTTCSGCAWGGVPPAASTSWVTK